MSFQTRNVITGVGILLVGGVLVVALFAIYNGGLLPANFYQDDAEPQARDLYEEGNHPTFATANSLFLQGPAYYSSARNLFNQMLIGYGLSADQRAHIEYKIALTYLKDDPKQAIWIMKAIVDNPTYPDQQKAYALQHLYYMWKFYSVSYDFDMVGEVFTGEPYNQFYQEGDAELSFYRLNQYAVSFGSAPFSNLGIALFDVHKLKDLDTNSAEYNSISDNIEIAIADAKDYMQRNADFAPNASLESRIMTNIADVTAQMALLGEESYVNDFPQQYERAIALNEGNALEASLGIRYAWTAAQVEQFDDGKSWESAVPYLQNALAIIETHPGVKTWLLHFETDQNDVYYDSVMVLRARSPEFDAYLSKEGWTLD